jgi:hypothetical protein
MLWAELCFNPACLHIEGVYEERDQGLRVQPAKLAMARQEVST